MTRDEIVAEARSYLDVRFKLHGRGRQGIDCIGLLIAVAEHFGQQIEDNKAYSLRNPFEVMLNKHLHKYCNAAPITPIRHGQIVKFRQSALPMHVGILTMDGPVVKVINANIKRRRVVEDNFSEWSKLLMEVREFKGVK